MGLMNDADEGLEHLQSAAREVVSAARSFLDAIEEVIDDRDRFGPIAHGLADLVERAGAVVTSAASNASAASPGSPTDSSGPPKAAPKRAARVQRITVE